MVSAGLEPNIVEAGLLSAGLAPNIEGPGVDPALAVFPPKSPLPPAGVAVGAAPKRLPAEGAVVVFWAPKSPPAVDAGGAAGVVETPPNIDGVAPPNEGWLAGVVDGVLPNIPPAGAPPNICFGAAGLLAGVEEGAPKRPPDGAAGLLFENNPGVDAGVEDPAAAPPNEKPPEGAGAAGVEDPNMPPVAGVVLAAPKRLAPGLAVGVPNMPPADEALGAGAPNEKPVGFLSLSSLAAPPNKLLPVFPNMIVEVFAADRIRAVGWFGGGSAGDRE